MYVCMVSMPTYQAEFGIDRTAASLPFTFLMLGFGVGGILIGRLVDRFGIVTPLLLSSLLLASTFFVATRLQSFIAFALVHALLGTFGCAAVFSPLMADISRWFLRRRGLAIAICASGNYLAGVIWPPIIESMIGSDGWRSMYTNIGLLSLIAMAPLLMLLRRPPPALDDSLPGGGSSGSAKSLGFTPGQLTAILSVAGIGCCTAMAMPQAHVVALAVDMGLPAAHGAQMLSLMFGCGIVSRLLFGWLSDRIGGLATLLASSSLQCISLLIFLPADGLYFLYAASATFGLFQGGIVPCYALIVREYFPTSEAGTRTGIIVFATLLGMAFGGWSAGLIYDWTGSYDTALLHGVGWNLLNIALIGFLIVRAQRDRHIQAPQFSV
jgi:MFS family permease